MTKVAKSAISSGHSLDYAVDTDFHGYALSYPILGVEGCHYEVSLSKFGGRNHATVLHAVAQVKKLSDSSDDFRRNLSTLKRKIQG